MRSYTFPVTFAQSKDPNAICRVRLNNRFTPRDMAADYPQNTTRFYLEEVLSEGTPAQYVVASGNALDIHSPVAKQITDAERAVLLNLIDFGQDFENDRSTTVEELVFFVPNPDDHTVAGLLQALDIRVSEARVGLTEAMIANPVDPDDPYIAKRWPEADHHRYRYVLVWSFPTPVPNAVAARSDGIHRLVMWNALSTTMTAKAAVEGKYTGVAYECFIDGTSVEYVVERPSCDPALAIDYLLSAMERVYGLSPSSSEITVVVE